MPALPAYTGRNFPKRRSPAPPLLSPKMAAVQRPHLPLPWCFPAPAAVSTLPISVDPSGLSGGGFPQPLGCGLQPADLAVVCAHGFSVGGSGWSLQPCCPSEGALGSSWAPSCSLLAGTLPTGVTAPVSRLGTKLPSYLNWGRLCHESARSCCWDLGASVSRTSVAWSTRGWCLVGLPEL